MIKNNNKKIKYLQLIKDNDNVLRISNNYILFNNNNLNRYRSSDIKSKANVIKLV